MLVHHVRFLFNLENSVILAWILYFKINFALFEEVNPTDAALKQSDQSYHSSIMGHGHL